MPQLVEASNMPPAQFVCDFFCIPKSIASGSNNTTEFRWRSSRCDPPSNLTHVRRRAEDQDHNFQHLRWLRPSHHRRLRRTSCRWRGGYQWLASLTPSSHHRWRQVQLHGTQGSGRYQR
jgi:hypothetical protein